MIHNIPQKKWVDANQAQCAKTSRCWFAFSTEESSETLESLALEDARSMLAMFLAILYMLDVLGIET